MPFTTYYEKPPTVQAAQYDGTNWTAIKALLGITDSFTIQQMFGTAVAAGTWLLKNEIGAIGIMSDVEFVLKYTTGEIVDISGAWPIGSVFISAVPTNPSVLLGFGTWTAFAAGKVLVGLDAADTDFDVVLETGGSKTVAAAGTNSVPTFTGSALGTHAHGVGTYATSSHAGTAVADHVSHTHSVTSNVAVAAHAFTQPTIAWPAGVPTIAGITVASHAAHTHTVTAAGTNSVPTFTGTAMPTHAHELPFSKAAGGTGQLKMLAPTIFGSGTSRAPESISAAPTANTTASTVGLSEAKSAGTPAGTITAPVFTGSSVTSGNESATLTHTVSSQGAVAWPAGMPTASGGAVDAHGVTNNAVTSGGPSAILSHAVTQPSDHTLSGSSAAISAGTPAGTVTAPNFTGTPTSVVQPYIVVYMWRRTV